MADNQQSGPSAEDFRQRARQNLEAAKLSIHQERQHPAASRIYYALFQALVAGLTERDGRKSRWEHGEVHDEADSFCKQLPTLGRDIRQLYSWRARADYATGKVKLKDAEKSVAMAHTHLQALGIEVAEE